MIDKQSNKKTKRLPKGQRTHIRRLKQAVNKQIPVAKPKAIPKL